MAHSAPWVAGVAWVVAAGAPLASAPRIAGVLVLLAGIAVGGAARVAARLRRPVSDDVAAGLDRAADLDGALRSAHWFAARAATEPAADRNADWVAFHLDDVAARIIDLDWRRVYEGPASHLRWGLTCLCAAGALAVTVRPLPIVHPTAGQASSSGAAQSSAPAPGSTAGSLAPQVVEGMIALRSGRAPSTAQLSAIDGVLSAAKANPVAHRQIEGQLSQLAARLDESTSSSEPDVEAGDSPVDDHNGFELADLEWAYQEAKGRARVDERSRPDTAAGASESEQPRDGKTAQRDIEPAASGAPGSVSIDADLRGAPANVLLQQSGRQQADGDPARETTSAPPGRGPSVAAALRHEVIHAQRDIEAPQADLSASRRATNPTQAPAGPTSSTPPVRYEPARASQPPAVPESRRALVRDFFLRPAEPRPPVKRP